MIRTIGIIVLIWLIRRDDYDRWRYYIPRGHWLHGRNHAIGQPDKQRDSYAHTDEPSLQTPHL
jgi:hypothetical protein